METFEINYVEYYLYEDIIEEYPSFKKGCNTATKVLTKYNLVEDDYVYMAEIDDTMEIVESNDIEDLFISKVWFDKYFDELAPPIINLSDTNKFRDDENNIVKIETRGYLTSVDCYFKVADVSKEFDLPNLRTTLIAKKSSYEEGTDYTYFYIGTTRIKKLYLTYCGILKVLFSSGGNKTTIFIRWATKTLFAAQLGTLSQRTKLASKLLDVDVDSVISIISTSPTPVACSYFFAIGTVGELRKKYNIPDTFPDDSSVNKYGNTCDFLERAREHRAKYGNQIELLIFNLVDPACISSSETATKRYFEDVNAFLDIEIDGQRETELVVIKKSQIKNVRSQYGLIGSKYVGKVREHAAILNEFVNNYEKQITAHKHEKELMQKNKELLIQTHSYELMKKDNEKELIEQKYTFELLKKNNKILKQKLELAKLKAKVKASK